MIYRNFYFELQSFKKYCQSGVKRPGWNKINELKKSIQSYIQQYDVVLRGQLATEQLKNQIQLQLLEVQKSLKISDYLVQFYNSHFKPGSLHQKIMLETQFLQLIMERRVSNQTILFIQNKLWMFRQVLKEIQLNRTMLIIEGITLRKNEGFSYLDANYWNLNQEQSHQLKRNKRI
ncbi:hypothetical protein pb186bvf_007189 [Paramecium bursaria]